MSLNQISIIKLIIIHYEIKEFMVFNQNVSFPNDGSLLNATIFIVCGTIFLKFAWQQKVSSACISCLGSPSVTLQAVARDPHWTFIPIKSVS